MTLYESLAAVFDTLFPMNPKTPGFLVGLTTPEGRIPAPRVLDLGCATGAHAIALAELGWNAVGIDSEAAMIAEADRAAARAGVAGRLSFAVMDMREIGTRFSGQAFDLMLCLGNTLPHLAGADRADAGDPHAEIARFLGAAHALLAPGAALVVQTLNFQREEIGPGYHFPELVSGDLTLRRSYHEPPAGQPGTLRFVVELIRGPATDRGETTLVPLAPARLREMLREAGFAHLTCHSGWDGAPFDEARDLQCITVARA